VLCAPSLGGESFGVVLLEAMAAGVPVVASDLTGYRAVARSGIDALLVPPENPEALAAALRQAMTEPERARSLAASGTAHVATFAMECLAQRYLELYRRLL
jgi:phosphatidylinositol alpha-mannosyltransferase